MESNTVWKTRRGEPWRSRIKRKGRFAAAKEQRGYEKKKIDEKKGDPSKTPARVQVRSEDGTQG